MVESIVHSLTSILIVVLTVVAISTFAKKVPIVRPLMLKGDKDYEPNPEHYLGSRWTFTLADLEQDAEFRVTE